MSRILILKSKQLLKSDINPVYLYHANVELTRVKNCHSNNTSRKYKPLKSEWKEKLEYGLIMHLIQPVTFAHDKTIREDVEPEDKSNINIYI